MTFRWFGEGDPVSLAHIRQVPGVEGIVSALHDVPPGEVGPRGERGGAGGGWGVAQREDVERRAARIEAAGMRFSVVESIPVHEEIKLGLPGRDRLVDRYRE